MMLGGPSLSRRLLIGAAVFITLALVVAGIVIFLVLHRFVQGQIDQRLDTQIVFLSSMLQADRDGRVSLEGNADGPPFDGAMRGWYWQVTGPGNALKSRSLGDFRLDPPDVSLRPRPPRPDRGDRKRRPSEQPVPADGAGPDAQRLHFRIQTVMLSGTGTAATIVASAPRAAVMGPLREAMMTLALSLGALGLALVLAMILQVRLGLRPLERLRQAVADVRAGRSDNVPASQPREIQPLAEELNGLLRENATNLERARRHVANLAHGLKTPLATLALAMPKSSAKPGELHDLIDLMERRIRHHLGRARAAALNGPARTQTLIGPRIADVAAVLAKIHADKALSLSTEVPAGLAVACEQQDFDEMIGNLLENAFKWAEHSVDVRANADDDRKIKLIVEDDGPGLHAEQMSQVLRPGQRLDESSPGFGFGLSITRELAELYGGSLDLGNSSSGGLSVVLVLPRRSGFG